MLRDRKKSSIISSTELYARVRAIRVWYRAGDRRVESRGQELLSAIPTTSIKFNKK